MTTRRLILSACVLWALSTALVASSQAAKPRIKLAPAVPCTMANRLDMFIDEDDIMWECTCETLKTGHICRWQVIGGVDPVNTRKRIRKHHSLRIVAYVKPGVVA